MIPSPSLTTSPFPSPAASPLFLVINASAGKNDSSRVNDTIHEVLTAGDREHEIAFVEDPRRLGEIAQRAVERALERQGAVVAVGGDGTVNAVAQIAVNRDCPFGVIPQGTFNYFGRYHGIPSDAAEAAKALLTARVQQVQVGLLNDRVFLVNASLGLYPELLEDREAFKKRFGRSRIAAMLAAVGSALREHRQLRLRIEHQGVAQNIRTPTLFVGNNRLQLEQIGIGEAPLLESGQLVALVLRPAGAVALFWLMLRGIAGQMGDARNVDTFGLQDMTVTPALRYGSKKMKVAIDGEVTWLAAPLRFRAAPKRLQLLVPVPEGT